MPRRKWVRRSRHSGPTFSRYRRAARPRASGIRGGFGTASTLTTADAAALASKQVAPDIKAVAPTTSSSETLTAGTSNWSTSVVGSTPLVVDRAWPQRDPGKVSRQSRRDRPRSGGRVGFDHRRGALQPRDPVGQTVNVSGVPMTVVGVLNTAGSSSSTSTTANPDDQVDCADHHRRRADLRGNLSELGEFDHHPGQVLRRPHRGLSGGRSPAAQPPRDHHGLQRRLHHHLLGLPAFGRHLGRPDADRSFSVAWPASRCSSAESE